MVQMKVPEHKVYPFNAGGVATILSHNVLKFMYLLSKQKPTLSHAN